MAKTDAERKATHRARREKEGLKRLELWLHPEDWPIVQKLAERLRKRRERQP